MKGLMRPVSVPVHWGLTDEPYRDLFVYVGQQVVLFDNGSCYKEVQLSAFRDNSSLSVNNHIPDYTEILFYSIAKGCNVGKKDF